LIPKKEAGKGGEKTKMQKTHKIVIAGVVVIAILIVAVVAVIMLSQPKTGPQSPPTVSGGDGGGGKSIVRNTDNAEEETALLAAENANYTDIFKVERFKGFSNSSDYSRYTWANFIDAEVIKYYDNRFESLEGKPKDIEFSYEANVYAWNQIHIVNGSPPENGSRYDDSITVSSPNGTILFKNADCTGPNWGMVFFYGNSSGYREIQAGTIDLEFSNCYVMEMKLKYSEVHGPLAAFISDVYEIIIVDKNFTPLLLCIQSIYAVS
jgi:hypothetical protein